MAYQKLQPGLAAEVIPSDTIPIPVPSSGTITGAASATVADKLQVATDLFNVAQLKAGAIVVNETTQTIATVTGVDSNTLLSLSANIMSAGNSFTLYLNPEFNRSEGCIIYVGGPATPGNLKVETVGGSVVTYEAIPAGTFVPIQVYKVFSTGTTATKLIANW